MQSVHRHLLAHQTIKETLRHARMSLLFDEHGQWTATSQQEPSDVTMGNFDGAEDYELVGFLILKDLT